MNRKHRVIFIIAGVILLAQLVSYLYSKSKLQDYYNRFTSSRNKIDSIRFHFIGKEEIKTEIDFERVDDYVKNYNKLHPVLIQLKLDFEKGDGLAFWFTDKRQIAMVEIDRYLKTQDSLSSICLNALESTKPYQQTKLDMLTKAKQGIEKSNHLITRPLKDEDDFNDHLRLLRNLNAELKAQNAAVIKAKSSIKSSGVTEIIQASILNSTITTFNNYSNLIHEQEVGLQKATRALLSGKPNIHSSLFDDLLNHWKQEQFTTGEFFAEDSCNMEYFRTHENVEGWGMPNEFNYLYGDLNNDGQEDALVYFYSYRCDGGNAPGSRYEILLLSNGSDYYLDEDYFKGFMLDGRMSWDYISNGSIYGTQSTYGNNDPNCCPSIKKKVAIDFNSRKLELSPNLEYTHYVIDVKKDIKDPYLNVRSNPSVSGQLMKKLPEGTKIILLECGYGNAGQWCKIQFSLNSSDIGYINKKYITSLRK